jgi:hypothetical protein
MAFTTREVLLDADLFRQAQPSWPHPEPQVPARARRIVPSSPVDCPVCQRPAYLCCVNERGAVLRAGLHRERLELEAGTRQEASS